MTTRVLRPVQDVQHPSRLLCFTCLTQDCNRFLDKEFTFLSLQNSAINHSKQQCLHYCTFLLNLLEDNPGLVNNLTMRDEAYFHLIATVKRKNFCYWSTENLCKLYQFTMHRRKATLFYTVSSFWMTSYTSLKTVSELALTGCANCFNRLQTF
jgi:hypothetical protein